MKKIIILFLFCLNAWAQTMTDSFTDKIKIIKPTKDGIKIGFEVHAAFYKLKKSHPDYKKIQMTLEELKKSHKNVKITASLPEMEIKEVSAE